NRGPDRQRGRVRAPGGGGERGRYRRGDAARIQLAARPLRVGPAARGGPGAIGAGRAQETSWRGLSRRTRPGEGALMKPFGTGRFSVQNPLCGSSPGAQNRIAVERSIQVAPERG